MPALLVSFAKRFLSSWLWGVGGEKACLQILVIHLSWSPKKCVLNIEAKHSFSDHYSLVIL
ncbi:MAG: hypothetical protein ATN31_09865 [Candidatus Epulonipiscioides saccharophilum]|nr:MAG: hypothetical protein ATN31_09865 [Epulopiscium sp. AS2M-Bin001]